MNQRYGLIPKFSGLIVGIASCAIFGVAIPIRFWNATAPTTRQRAERAAQRIWDDYELAGKVTIAAVADIITAEF